MLHQIKAIMQRITKGNVPTMTPSDRPWDCIPANPGVPGYSEDLRRRAEQVLSGTNLIEVILYSHLLLEQALDLRIQARFDRPGVLANPRLARLSFAQKVTVYAGLYAPDEDQVALLQAMNRLRNRTAHTFADLDEAALQCLPDQFRTIPYGPDMSDGTALCRVQAAFLQLALDELQAFRGVHRRDLNVGILDGRFAVGVTDLGFRRLVLLGDHRQLGYSTR